MRELPPHILHHGHRAGRATGGPRSPPRAQASPLLKQFLRSPTGLMATPSLQPSEPLYLPPVQGNEMGAYFLHTGCQDQEERASFVSSINRPSSCKRRKIGKRPTEWPGTVIGGGLAAVCGGCNTCR